MKKYIYLLLSILVLVLSACGAQKNSAESVPLSPEQEKAAKTFLEMVYTTNYNSRMDKLNMEKMGRLIILQNKRWKSACVIDAEYFRYNLRL